MICANKLYLNKKLATTLTLLVLAGCATSTETRDDPLKYSKKLISEGHGTLYDNGAFEVPYTQIKIIPAGETALELASEMTRMRARQAFLTSIKNAADAIHIIPAGTKLSVDYAKKISGGSSTAGDIVTDVSRPSGRYIISHSVDLGKDVVLESWQFGKKTSAAIDEIGIGLVDHSLAGGAAVVNKASDAGDATINKSVTKAKSIAASTHTHAKKSLQSSGKLFVKGYVAVPSKHRQRKADIAAAAQPKHFSQGMDNSLEFRSKYSGVFTNLIGDTTRNYTADVGSSFKNAGTAFKENVDDTGFGLALLKASRWVLQGVLWDGFIEPITKLGTASVGYVSVNLAAFPVMVIYQEGKAVTSLAIEVTWNTAGTAYDVVAPSATAAMAAVYSIFQITGGYIATGAVATGGSIVGGTEIIAGQVAGNTIKGVGFVSGKAVQYIGVPLTAAGVTLGAGTVGVVAGTAGAVTGGAIVITGEATSVTTKAFGNIIAGTTAVVGTTTSVAAGTAVGAYEITKAVVVPAGYELGGGIVLGYGGISQLAAHSVLAVADASYLVLSLEGPRWIIYAVKGNLGEGDDLPPGTVLDLKAMQERGEAFEYLPVSDEEMRAVISNSYQELPEVQTTAEQ
jgi:hypothetical protein